MKTQVLAKRILILLAIFILLACPNGESAEKKESKGGSTIMKTYMIGRFAVDVPEDMKLTVRNSKLRMTEMEEYFIPPHYAVHEKAMEKLWKDHLTKINALTPPRKKEKVLIETRDFPEISKVTRGVFYYGNYVFDNEAQLDVLLDAGSVAVMLKHDGTLDDPVNQKKMVNNLINIAKAYRAGYPDAFTPGDWFYLEHGAINLPYRWQEKVFVRFEGGPYNLNLSFDMNAVEQVQHVGLLQRMAAAIMMNFVPGLKLDKIRSGSRTVGGLKGEEIVMRGTENNNTEVRFGWEYPGKEESGEYPRIQISMESPDGNIEEKLKIWDAILDSFKPTYKTSK